MQFLRLAQVSESLSRESRRLQKVARLAELLAGLAADEIEPAVAFLSGTTRQGRIGVGHGAISAAGNIPASDEPVLTVVEVDRVLAEIADTTGKGSVGVRARQLADLLRRATPLEQGFLRRLLHGELRQGALEGLMVDAIARAAAVSPASVRRAVMMRGDPGPVARRALLEGEPGLASEAIQLMRPVQPMLAASGEDLQQALTELDDPSLEYKLDGARVQVHKAGDQVRLFSRALHDVTASAPEIVSVVRSLPVRDLILDGELLALRPDGTPHPFQVTMRRFGRTRGIAEASRDTPLTPFFFDCLYADGTALIDEPLSRRTQALDAVARQVRVARLVRPDSAAAEAFLADALARGHEGVMAKDLGSPYAAGRRGASWLKLKRARTLDLVVIAAEWGHGRRQGWLSNLHLGARDPDRHQFIMLGKTFKGMTDDMLRWQTEKLLELAIGRDAHTVHVRPELVVEVAFNEIQESRVYPGGLALRFARVKRYRTDKTALEADTIHTVRVLAGQGGTP